MYKILRNPIEVRGNTDQPTIRCRDYEGTERTFLADCDDAAYQRIQTETEQWKNGPSFRRRDGLILLGVCEKLFQSIESHNFKVPLMLVDHGGQLKRPQREGMRNGAMYWVPVQPSIDGTVLPWSRMVDVTSVGREVYCNLQTKYALEDIAKPDSCKFVCREHQLFYKKPFPPAVEKWLQEHKFQREGHLYWFSNKEKKTIRLPETVDLGDIPAEEGSYGFRTYKVNDKLSARLDELCTIRIEQ